MLSSTALIVLLALYLTEFSHVSAYSRADPCLKADIIEELKKKKAHTFTKIPKWCREVGIWPNSACKLKCRGGYQIEEEGKATCGCDRKVSIKAPRCQENKCDCENGSGASGADCPTAGEEKCSDCYKGYHLNHQRTKCVGRNVLSRSQVRQKSTKKEEVTDTTKAREKEVKRQCKAKCDGRSKSDDIIFCKETRGPRYYSKCMKYLNKKCRKKCERPEE